MADRPSSFVRDWIAQNVRVEPSADGDPDARTASFIAELKDEARKAALDMTDPELDDDLLRDEIRAAIQRAAEPKAG